MAEGVLDLVWLFGETNRTMLKGASASKASGGTSFLGNEASDSSARQAIEKPRSGIGFG
jgi:hypothetical protein